MLTPRRLEVLFRISARQSVWQLRYQRQCEWLVEHGYYDRFSGITEKGRVAVDAARAMRDLLKEGGAS